MRVIKRGSPPDEKAYRLTCPICETEFEAFQHETRLSQDQRDIGIRLIDCPVCSKTSFFDERKASADAFNQHVAELKKRMAY